eukprot:9331755-Alexandrium_andersonii.AAC.1
MASGFPVRVLSAFAGFAEAVVVRLAVARGLGEPRNRSRSLAQGDPLANVFFALLVTPWCRAMDSA